MKLLNRMICVVILVLSLLASGSAVLAKVQLIFSEEIQCTGSRMLLGQIAIIEGNGDLSAKLKAIDLGPSPKPGGKFTLTQDIIIGNILRQGISLDEIELIGINSKGIIIRGAGQRVLEEVVMDKIYEYVYSHLPAQFSDIEIIVKSFPEIWIPNGDYQVEIGPHRSSKIWGFLSLPVIIMMNEEQIDREQVSLEIRVFQTVFVARELINRETVITPDMVELSFADITNLRGEPVFSGEELFGKVTKRAINTGDVVTKDLLENSKLVLRNEQVIIEVIIGNIHIQALGKALQNGGLGDWINVVNLDSGITIQAQVIGVGQVQAKVD